MSSQGKGKRKGGKGKGKKDPVCNETEMRVVRQGVKKGDFKSRGGAMNGQSLANGELSPLHSVVGTSPEQLIYRVKSRYDSSVKVYCPLCTLRMDSEEDIPLLFIPPSLGDVGPSATNVHTQCPSVYDAAMAVLDKMDKERCCDLCLSVPLFHAGEYGEAFSAVKRGTEQIQELLVVRAKQQFPDRENVLALVNSETRMIMTKFYTATSLFFEGSTLIWPDRDHVESFSLHTFEQFKKYLINQIKKRREQGSERMLLQLNRLEVLKEYDDELNSLEEAYDQSKDKADQFLDSLPKDERLDRLASNIKGKQTGIEGIEKALSKMPEGHPKVEKMKGNLESYIADKAELEQKLVDLENHELLLAMNECKKALNDLKSEIGLAEIEGKLKAGQKGMGVYNGAKGVAFETCSRIFVERFAQSLPISSDESIHVINNVKFQGLPQGVSTEFDFFILKQTQGMEIDEVLFVVECKVNPSGLTEDIGQMMDSMQFFSGQPFVEGDKRSKRTPGQVKRELGMTWEGESISESFSLSDSMSSLSLDDSESYDGPRTFSGRRVSDNPTMTFVGCSIDVPEASLDQDEKTTFILTPESFQRQTPIVDKETEEVSMDGVLYVTNSGFVEVGPGAKESVIDHVMDDIRFDVDNPDEQVLAEAYIWAGENVWDTFPQEALDRTQMLMDKNLIISLKQLSMALMEE